jgi:hypothetical protein
MVMPLSWPKEEALPGLCIGELWPAMRLGWDCLKDEEAPFWLVGEPEKGEAEGSAQLVSRCRPPLLPCLFFRLPAPTGTLRSVPPAVQ